MRIFFQQLKIFITYLLTSLVRLGNTIKYGFAIKKYLKNNPQQKLSNEQKRSVQGYFAKYGFKNLNINWHRFYSGFYQKFSTEYIPEDIFFSYIENTLNDTEYYALQDKNLLNKLFKDFNQPKTIVQNINGFFKINGTFVTEEEAIETILGYASVIVKSTLHTYGGKSVIKVDILGNQHTCSQQYFKQLFLGYEKNFIVQEVVDQSETMMKLNPTSLNTIRICTYLRESSVVILFAIVRFGSKGNFLDSVTGGGFYRVVNDNGSLKETQYSINIIDDSYNKTSSIDNFLIPNYDEIKSMVRRMHKEVPYFKMISWDIALDKKNKPVLIEYNIFGQSIVFQATNGPLFGEYTEEVLTLTQKKYFT
ncbi:sugar-transfer associated ATP-grasp domain-containing protein [Maribacter sp. ACAM166]|uniref:sugar-transfer associated ATP-grasp domain-containing protein n=1 Tax=Maribacter sp. ACAM166 TaxID=2508996 RepID=UPI0010FF1761|nr:sugar-transfer associated ATP-grasp domain-containing protein [Maribacter sp. ACAM166]TLP70593.1 hypothetical protein ES765_20800 [Maribacter sp. ACAM166]